MTEAGTPDPAVGDDPDAPWRPGYTGPEPTPPPTAWAEPTTPPAAVEPPDASVPAPWSREADDASAGDGSDAPPSGVDADEAERARQVALSEAPASVGRGLVGAVGALVAICLVVAAVATVGLLNDGDERRSALPIIPENLDERWSAAAPGVTGAWTADGVVAVRAEEGIVVFDADGGDELWTLENDGEAMTIEFWSVGEAFVLLDRSSDSLVATGLDPRTGDELWNRNVAERREIFDLRDRIIEYEFEQETQSGRFALLSPRTGLPTGERLRIVDVATAPPFVSATTIDDEDTVLYNIDTDERVVVPIDWEAVDALTLADGRLLALTDGSLALYDDAGEVVDEIDVTLGPDQESPNEIFSVPGAPAVVVGADGRSMGIAIDGDTLTIRWSADGQVQLVDRTDDGPRAVLVSGGFDPDRSVIVDPIDGEIVFEVDTSELLVLGFESQSFGQNGLVYADGSNLVAVDASGEPLWELDEPGGFFVDDGLLVEFTDDGITVYG